MLEQCCNHLKQCCNAVLLYKSSWPIISSNITFGLVCVISFHCLILLFQGHVYPNRASAKMECKNGILVSQGGAFAHFLKAPLWGFCMICLPTLRRLWLFQKKKRTNARGGDGHSWNWWWGGRGLKWCYKGIITSISLFLCFFHLHYSNLCVYSPPKIFPFILIKQLCSNSSSSNLTCR